jgi:hypothetical protein
MDIKVVLEKDEDGYFVAKVRTFIFAIRSIRLLPFQTIAG